MPNRRTSRRRVRSTIVVALAVVGGSITAIPHASAVSGQVTGTTLTVTSDDTGEEFSVKCTGGNVVVADLTPTGGPIACSSLTALTVAGNGGDDGVSLNQITGVLFPALTDINVHLGAGNDTVYASQLNDSLDGGLGNDTWGDNGSTTVTATTTTITTDSHGTDSITAMEDISISATAFANDVNLAGFPGSSLVSLQGGIDTFQGAAGPDHVYGGDEADEIETNGGADTIEPGAGADDMDGGTGNDTIVDLAGGITLTNTSLSDGSIDTFVGIETASLGLAGSGTIDATAFSGSAALVGSGSADTLLGGSGADLLTGGGGGDTMNGGGGNDRFQPGAGNDIVQGDTGTDTLEDTNAPFTLTNTSLTGDGTDTLTGIEEAALTGTTGSDTITAATFTGKTLINGDLGSDIIKGGTKADLLRGNGGKDKLFGFGGNDKLDGGSEKDSCKGGPGMDQLKHCEADRA